MLPQAQTLVQGVYVGIVLACFFVFYRAAHKEGPLHAKAWWPFFLAGMFLVGVGLSMRLLDERPMSDALLLKYIDFAPGAIAVGYSLLLMSAACIFQCLTKKDPRSDSEI